MIARIATGVTSDAMFSHVNRYSASSRRSRYVARISTGTEASASQRTSAAASPPSAGKSSISTVVNATAKAPSATASRSEFVPSAAKPGLARGDVDVRLLHAQRRELREDQGERGHEDDVAAASRPERPRHDQDVQE